jgi:hypothetical protein
MRPDTSRDIPPAGAAGLLQPDPARLHPPGRRARAIERSESDGSTVREIEAELPELVAPRGERRGHLRRLQLDLGGGRGRNLSKQRETRTVRPDLDVDREGGAAEGDRANAPAGTTSAGQLLLGGRVAQKLGEFRIDPTPCVGRPTCFADERSDWIHTIEESAETSQQCVVLFQRIAHRSGYFQTYELRASAKLRQTPRARRANRADRHPERGADLLVTGWFRRPKNPQESPAALVEFAERD